MKYERTGAVQSIGCIHKRAYMIVKFEREDGRGDIDTFWIDRDDLVKEKIALGDWLVFGWEPAEPRSASASVLDPVSESEPPVLENGYVVRRAVIEQERLRSHLRLALFSVGVELIAIVTLAGMYLAK